MNSLVAIFNPVKTRADQILLRQGLLVQARSYSRRSGSSVKRKTTIGTIKSKADAAQPRPVSELLEALKGPIQKCKERISELEMVLEAHQKQQAKEEEQFQHRMKEIDRREPQRKWYYDQFGITQKEQEKSVT